MILNKIKHITIFTFGCLIIVPGLLFFINHDLNFQLKKPQEALKNLRKDFEDHYGFKDELLDTYVTTKTSFLNDEVLQNRVIKGKNNWWFLGDHYNNSLSNVYGNIRFSDYELNLIAYNLSSWQSYLKEKGILFYVIIPPNKNKIYSEHLPFSLKKTQTRVEQLQQYLNKKSDVNFLDLTETLLDKKINNDIYIKNDTHWNSLGAYFAYVSTMDVIKKSKPDIEIENINYYAKNSITKYKGDIPRMLKQKDYSIYTKLIKHNTSYKTEINTPKIKVYSNYKKELNTLIYHDSFMLAMMPFFNETFKKTTYIKSFKLSEAEIDKHKPDIVILEIVERNLDFLLKLKKPLN